MIYLITVIVTTLLIETFRIITRRSNYTSLEKIVMINVAIPVAVSVVMLVIYGESTSGLELFTGDTVPQLFKFMAAAMATGLGELLVYTALKARHK